MGPGILIAAVLGVGIWLVTRGGRRQTTETQKSARTGYTWRLDATREGAVSYVMVTAPSSQFGVAGKDLTVLTYAVPAGQTGPRTLISWGIAAPREMIDAAILDYGITVPSGVTLPERAAGRPEATATTQGPAYVQAKGNSGTVWQVIKGVGDFVSVGATAGTLGLSYPAQVMVYKNTPEDAGHPRVLVAFPPDLPRVVLMTAVTDFQVSIPGGMKLPTV